MLAGPCRACLEGVTRAHRVTLIALLCVIPLASCDLPAPAPTDVELAEQKGIEHEKLRHLLGGFQVIDVTLQRQLQDLREKYGPVEAGNVYQGIDLTNFGGILRARQRLEDFSAKYDGLDSAQVQHFAAVADLVRNNDLAEPLASEFEAALSMDEVGYDVKYRAWFSAARAYEHNVAQFLDLAQQRARKLIWQDDRLVASDAQTATELRTAQGSLATSERRYNQAGRAALDAPEETRLFIRSALVEIEKGMSRRDGT
jgi:hypothetical protein